ncbi:MAG: DUF4091 domain-containing protein [Eubacteriales bacterium]
MICTKLVSSLEKCFVDEPIEKFEALRQISMLKNERLSVQLLYTARGDEETHTTRRKLSIEGAPAAFATVRTVEQVPVMLAAPDPVPDGNYLRTAPGIYPDILQPLHYHESVTVVRNHLLSVWVEFDPRDRLAAGEYEVTFSLTDADSQVCAQEVLRLDVIDADLPPQELIFTQWFHCDTLANYYNCEPWSERHWEIVENFAKAAVRNGVNLLLTPIHTPPLDTEMGGERLTTQLVDVTLEDGVYSFGFEKLDRWIDLCDRIGIQYFEIAHFFTQWGAEHAPKIMATVNGEYKKLFGWETDATGEEYTAYLRTFITAFLAHMKARGDDKRCFFHVSDEPSAAHLSSYRAAKNVVADLLKDYVIMDALSNFEYWSAGLVRTPIPASDHIEPFIEAKVPGLWTYYCCGQTKDVSNRLVAMPLWRTRSIGMQMYKFDIAGFLHWGFNHFNNCGSIDAINPYTDLSGDYWVPAGDTHSVYPAQNGTALESIRIISFYEALQDLRAMKLAETVCGKEILVSEMEKRFGGEIRFDRCAHDAVTLLSVREYVNSVIKQSLQ